MTGIPPQAITAAQAYDLEHRPKKAMSWTRVPDDQVARLLAGAAPFLAEDGRDAARDRITETNEAIRAERERIAAEIDPAKLDLLADWFDADDALKEAGWPVTPRERGHEVQDDLRRWANLLREDPA